MKFWMKQLVKKIVSVLLTCGLASLLIPQPILGQVVQQAPKAGQPVPFPQVELELIQQAPVAEGVKHYTYRGILADGEPIMVQVIEADLLNPEVEVKPIAAQEGNYGKRESVASMGARSGAVAAVNGGFYSTAPPYTPVGSLVIDGRLEAASAIWRTSMAWLEEGRIVFGYFNMEEYPVVEDEAGEAVYTPGIKHLLTGGPLLVDGGKPVYQYPLEGLAGSLAARQPRTAVGGNHEGKMFLVTVDGRQPGVSVGVTFEELSLLMIQLGAEVAMGLDGGGSTTAWVNGRVVNQVSDSSQRLVANGLIVRSGIAVFIDGKRVYFDVPPRVEAGRTLVPLRAFFEALGAAVDWYGETQRIVAHKDGLEVQLTVGAKEALVNGETVILDVPAKVEEGRTLVPLRFVSEALGADVEWDPARIITVNSKRGISQ